MSYQLTNASIYSTKGEIAYSLTYTNGDVIYQVRAVQSKDRFIRCENLVNGEWVQSGKPYIVAKNKKRNAERIQEKAINFLSH
jgi:choline kinase